MKEEFENLREKNIQRKLNAFSLASMWIAMGERERKNTGFASVEDIIKDANAEIEKQTRAFEKKYKL